MFAFYRIALLVAMATATVAAQASLTLPAHFTAVALGTGGPVSNAVATRVDITINRWSTPAESQRLVNVLKEKEVRRESR